MAGLLTSRWLEDHYNYYSSFINTNWWYNYKRLYFRTKTAASGKRNIRHAGCMSASATTSDTDFGGNFGYSLVDHVNLWETLEMLLPSSGEGYRAETISAHGI